VDSLFDDPDSTATVEAAPIADPLGQGSPEPSFIWNGRFDSKLESRYGWVDFPDGGDALARGDEGLGFSVSGTLSFDARPDRDFRVFGKFKAAYPFSDATAANSIRIFELFSDFNLARTVYFRFGKQTLSWGLSRFYQLADPLSVAVKDPQDPEADLEGPLSLKASLPFGRHTLFAYAVAKDSYLPNDLSAASLSDLGYGVKGDFLIRLPDNPLTGDAELSVGAYRQADLAPVLTFGLSSNIGKVQFFTEPVLSWGLNRYRLTDEAVASTSSGTVYGTEKAGAGAYFAAVVGFSYLDSNLHLSVYGEYLYDGSGSLDSRYLGKLATRFAWENEISGRPSTVGVGDLLAYQSAHNTALFVSLDELFGNDKLSVSAFWQANWVDLSGFVVPSFTFKPNVRVELSLGCRLSYGDDRDEFVLKTSDPTSFEARRATVFLAARLGYGAF